MTNPKDCPMTVEDFRKAKSICYAHGLDITADMLDRHATWLKELESPWVSVSERLPTDSEWRLCKTNRHGKCVVAKFKGGGWIASIVNGFMGIPDEVITHFRDEPLPESEADDASAD